MSGRALVAYASKHGSTAGIAEAIGQRLREHGLSTAVLPACEVGRVDDYDIVVVGSAVYMLRWQGDAVDFLQRFQHELGARPTWLFSSGPTGGDAKAEARLTETIAGQPGPPGNVARLGERIAIRGHRVFGGRIGGELRGWLERWVPKGDWRDFNAVRAWADEIANAVPAGVGVG